MVFEVSVLSAIYEGVKVSDVVDGILGSGDGGFLEYVILDLFIEVYDKDED